MSHNAATLTYVRTPDGVIQVDEGDALPEVVDEVHLATLLDAGAVTEQAAPELAKGKTRP